MECENHLEANILLSLAGVKSIMSNQWNSTVAENSEKLQSILKELLESKQSCGEIIRYRQSPALKKTLSNLLKKEEENKQVAPEKEKKDKNTKKDNETVKTPTKSLKNPSQDKTIDEKSVDQQQLIQQIESKEELSDADLHNKKLEQNLIKNLEVVKKEHSNMIIYGLPDFYLIN